MVVIVTGMHRSGTSALAGVLHNNGIVMGGEQDFFPPPQKENPKGFFENVQFRRANDAILKKQNYFAKSFDPDVPQSFDLDLSMRLEMANLIRKYDSKDIMWGWKDPRTSLTASCWLSVLAELKMLDQVVLLNCVRSPIAIGESMRGRGNKEAKSYQFEALAAAYYSTLYHTTNQWRRSMAGYMNIFFNGLISRPNEVLQHVSVLLGREIRNNGFIEKSVSRYPSDRTLCAGEETCTILQSGDEAFSV